MRNVAYTAMALVLSNIHAQNPAGRPTFEVASVKPSTSDARGPSPMIREMLRSSGAPGVIPMANPGRIRIKNWALLDLIAAAYGVGANQVSGPAWLANQDFDIDATVPAATQKTQLNAMLESLLEERFALKVHRVTETKPGFALVVGKNGPKLSPARSVPDLSDLTPEERQAKRTQQAQDGLKAAQKRLQEDAENGTPRGRSHTVTWVSVTTAELAANLVRLADAPVVDETSLTGKYSLSIETWTNADFPGGTVFNAVEKLGLKLEPRQVKIETLVVDQVSKTATAN